ncbi:MAG TPA: hypothetical protein VFE62_03585 [Gemmataceae bacterium]|nr:hypothetical protein [Gemmataceae bacterium]
MNQLNGWKNAQVVRVGAIQLYFGLHDDCPTCRALIGFEVDGHARVVCDASEKRGGLAHTTTHRKHLQPDIRQWVTPAQFATAWLELTGIQGSCATSCSGPTCALPAIGFFAPSVSAKVVTLGDLFLCFSYDNNGCWPEMVAFQRAGQEPVVCDASNWPGKGHAARTRKHRLALADDKDWLAPVEFHRHWLQEDIRVCSSIALASRRTTNASK